MTPLDAVEPIPVRRLRYAGNPRIALAIGLWAVAGAILGLIFFLVAGLALVQRWPWVGFWVGGAGAVLMAAAVIACLGLAVAWLLPPRSRAVRRDPAATREMRREANRLARDWRDVARQIFPPVRNLDGSYWLPGLEGVAVGKDGSLLIQARFPNLAIPGGRQAYLDQAADELPDVVPVASALALKRGHNVGTISVVIDDVTLGVRRVEAA